MSSVRAAEYTPESWRVTWDPDEVHPAQRLDPGMRDFDDEGTARNFAVTLRVAGRRSVRLWHRPAFRRPGWSEVPIPENLPTSG